MAGLSFYFDKDQWIKVHCFLTKSKQLIAISKKPIAITLLVFLCFSKTVLNRELQFPYSEKC